MNQQTRVTVPGQTMTDSTARGVDVADTPVYSGTGANVQVADHGPVRWGPIWTGLFVAVSSFVVIELLLYWIGALAIDWGTGTLHQGAGNAWISAVVAIVTFFLGGWAAGSAKVLRGTGSGLLTGYLVWALSIVLIVALSAIGLGPVFGSAGYAFNNLVMSGHQLPGGPNPPAFVGAIRDGAGWGFLFLVLSAIGSCFGGWLGNHGRPAPAEVATNV